MFLLRRLTLNHPLPTPESVFASDTFFMYAITGPLWEESMTSLGPEVRVWRHVRVAWEPAWTVITVLVLVVGLGPPLQTMSLEVTSVMGYDTVSSCSMPAWDMISGETYAIVRGDADAITDSTVVQRDEDGVRSRRRSGCGNSEGCGELHLGLDGIGEVIDA